MECSHHNENVAMLQLELFLHFYLISCAALMCSLIFNKNQKQAQIREQFIGWRAVSNSSGKAAESDTSVNVLIVESCVLKRFVSTSAQWLHCPSWCATGLACVTFAGFVSGMLSFWLEAGRSRFSCVFPSLLFCTQIFQGTEIHNERKRVLEHKSLSKMFVLTTGFSLN